MFEAIVTIVLGIVFAVCATWVAQRVLGTAIGRTRAVVLVLLTYFATVPVARAALDAGDVMEGGEFIVASPMGYVFLALALGWQFALAVTVIMIAELFWPSGRSWHPIRAIREALRRRKRVRRYLQTLRIASKHGLSLYGSHRRGEDQNIPQALVAVMNEAGPTFVKIGQVLSTRDDVLPREFTDAFATLQMQTTPLPWSEARVAIEAELSGPIAETFAWVDEMPMAAASLGQVHAARLLPDADGQQGADVVIKIQRPDARASIEIDSDILVRLAAEAERRASWARAYGVSKLVAEFVGSLNDELDYRIELANTQLLRDTLARSNVSTIGVPEVYPDLCTERMLVQEKVAGVPFAKLHGGLPEAMTQAPPRQRTGEKSIEAGEVSATVEWSIPDPLPTAREIADTLVDTIFEQVAVRGIFHADLHPGNLILRPDGQIVLIDFGSVGILERSLRRVLIAMMSAVSAEDDIALTDLLLMIVGEPVDGSELDRQALQHEIGVVLTRVHNAKVDASIFTDVLDVLRRHELAMPPALVLVFRTLSSLEGTLRRLVPDYDMVTQALSRTSYFAGLTMNPQDMMADARTQLQVVAEQIRRIPRRVEAIGSQLENGTFGISLRMFRDARERSWVGSLVGQLTTALVGVVLIVAAVVLVVFGSGPMLTPDVALFPFLGTVLGLGGMLLVLRSLRIALTREGSRSW